MRYCYFLLASLLLVTSANAAEPASPYVIWFDQPAAQWIDGLPIGCGRLGAMVMGGTGDERIQFNEDTLWTGKPHDYVRQGAADHLGEIRQLVFSGKAGEAEKLARETMLSDPVRQKAFQPFGDLRLHFDGHDAATDYRRTLDLDSAVARVTYKVGGTTFTRDVFASFPAQAIIVRLTADKPASISFQLRMDSPHKASQIKAISADTLSLTGQVADPTVKPNPEMGMTFEARLRVLATGGTTKFADEGVSVQGADSATLVLVAATSFKNFQDITADPAAACEAALSKIDLKDYDGLLAAHLEDHRKLFRRVSLDAGKSDRDNWPTNQRVAFINKENSLEADPGLAALHFEFGRYLMISCSRPGSQPANLQGVWNDQLNPPWESKWTTNINLEMNYWPVEPTNISECADPLFDLIGDLVISGSRTAKEQYNCGGWVLHHNTDLWRGTAPINNIDGIWPTGGAWLCYHMWEHYLFTGDRDFLATRAYPAMKQASQFFLDYLVKDPNTGFLVSVPSFSPEQGGMCAGPAMDNELIRALFDSTIQAAGTLGIDADFAAKVSEVRNQVAPDKVGTYGQLMEWQKQDPKIDVPNFNHRHMSPLWGMYPGAQFTPAGDPKIWEAAKTLLSWRLSHDDGVTGWSFAWRNPLAARVHDGDMALHQFGQQIAKKTYPNCLDKCGPYQIDGNFGACAGVAEMLLQSHIPLADKGPLAFNIDLLPALPKAWPTGSVTGLRARGGFEIDETWADGKLTKAAVRSTLGNPCKVRYGDKAVDLTTTAGQTVTFDGELKAVGG
jgi:alpha-L-fucosidase 2